MALEQKSGDLMLMGALLAFLIIALFSIFNGFDFIANDNTLSNSLELNANNTNNDYKAWESGVQTLVSSDSGFKPIENYYIDVRGDAESDYIKEKSQTSFKNFITNIQNSGLTQSIIDNKIWAFLISLVILISGIIGLRMVLGNGRI